MKRTGDSSNDRLAWVRGHADILLFPGPGMWLGLFACILATTAWLLMSPIHVDLESVWQIAKVSILFIILGILLFLLTGSNRLIAFAFGLSYLLIMVSVGRVLNYMFISLGFPLQDATLDGFHRLIGFDWLAFARWMDGHPWLVDVLAQAYWSFNVLSVAVFAHAIVLGYFRRLKEFLLLFSLTGLATVVIAGFTPALGTFAHHGLGQDSFKHIPDWAGVFFLEHVKAVHAGQMQELVLGRLSGLATFPSFHTILALLFAWAFRGTFLQWPAWIWSGLIILATPVMGGHYIIDLVGGAVVFWLAVVLSRRLGLADSHVPQRAAQAGESAPAGILGQLAAALFQEGRFTLISRLRGKIGH